MPVFFLIVQIPDIKKKLFRLIIVLAVLLLLGGGAALMFTGERTEHFVAHLLDKAGMADTPEIAARNLMQACSDGDSKKVLDLLSDDARNRYSIRAALSTPPKNPAELFLSELEAYTAVLKDMEWEYQMENQARQIGAEQKQIVRVLVYSAESEQTRIVKKELMLEFVRASSGQWKLERCLDAE